MDDRQVFAEVLIEILKKYMKNERGPFGLALFAPVHQRTANAMIMKAQIFKKNPTDENWRIFISAFIAFHEELVENKSTTLLPAINDYVAKSAFPHMLSVVSNFERLNELAKNLECAEIITVPSKIYVIDDLVRELSHLSVSANSQTEILLSDLIQIQSEDRDDEMVRVITAPTQQDPLYSGSTTTEGAAEKAVAAISKQLGKTFPQEHLNQQFKSIIPFLSQNGILEKPMADCFPILKICTYLDSVKDRVQLPGMDNVEEIREAANDNLAEFGFEPMQPRYSANIDVSESGITVTETFLFEKYRFAVGPDADAGEEHTFTTPIEVVNTFTCVVAEDGQSATIKDQTVQFSASHPAPKLSQSAPSKADNK